MPATATRRHATLAAETVVTTFADIGLDALVGGRSGFVSVTRDFVMHGLVTLLPAGRVALELHRSDVVDPQVLAELERLGGLGYTIVLDGFVMRDDSLPLLEVADYVKLDARAFSRDELAAQVAELEPYDVELIAAGIEDHPTFELCKEVGFDYFQGDFFCRPRTVAGHGIPANRLAQMRMMAVLQDPDCELDDLERRSAATSASASGCCAGSTPPTSCCRGRSARCARR